ncbi:DUF1642 domain-containing protein [Enterococcus faecalis]|uniref:DUF1642 domain-containing protein n=1 Tax=Enterococcus faecalis TaxID=1351 RepID=UPI0003544354|nr:DUF1642 domain-containing protein [Enterococcus faecalis]EPH89736.1 hypothetical protein D921_02685 [Enterococcus faecalis F01966]MCU2241443.1 DUF1642 domain-containing protein [Enterococcus faecalis]
MNKQELIEELECLEIPADSYSYFRGAKYVVERAISLAKQLDEPKKVKVVVPQVVADWIKYAKQQGYEFMQSYDPKKMFYPINDGLDKWINDNEETFAHAWLDGYEVMKEPLYYVKLPEIGYMRFGFCIPVTESIEEAKKYTEQEIKAVDERYWPFAVKVEEE